jgi:hypothetical protein
MSTNSSFGHGSVSALVAITQVNLVGSPSRAAGTEIVTVDPSSATGIDVVVAFFASSNGHRSMSVPVIPLLSESAVTMNSHGTTVGAANG